MRAATARWTDDQGELEAALELGRRFRVRRQELGLTQHQVGETAGLHRSTIGSLERGDRHVKSSTVVLASLGVERPIEAMLAGIGWEPGQEPGLGIWHIERALAPVGSE